MRLSALVLLIALALFSDAACTDVGIGYQLTVGEERGGAGLLDRSWRWEGSSSWEGELAELELALTARWEDERHHPREYKTKHGHTVQFELTTMLDPAELEWTWTHEEREYPHANHKSWHADKLEFKFNPTPWTLTLAHRDKAFPWKPSADLMTTEVELTLALDEGAAAFMLKSETYPHEPRKGRHELVWSLNQEFQDPTIAAALEFAMLCYPYTPEKDLRKLSWELSLEPSARAGGVEFTLTGEAQAGRTKRARESTWALEWSRDPWRYEMGYKSSEATYPTALAKDKLHWQRHCSLSWEDKALALTGEVLQERVSYPHASGKDYRKRKYHLELELEGLQMELFYEDIAYPNRPGKDRHTWGIAWEANRDLEPGLELALEGALKQTHYPHDPARDRLTSTWTLAVSLES